MSALLFGWASSAFVLSCTLKVLSVAEIVTGRHPAPVDLVILVDVYHHIGAREKYFGKLRESIKANGRVAVIDFRMDASMGPSKAMRIAPEQVKAEMTKAGYALSEEHGFLPQQYFLVFRRAAQ